MSKNIEAQIALLKKQLNALKAELAETKVKARKKVNTVIREVVVSDSDIHPVFARRYSAVNTEHLEIMDAVVGDCDLSGCPDSYRPTRCPLVCASLIALKLETVNDDVCSNYIKHTTIGISHR